MKKGLCLIMCLILLTGCLAGCGQTTGNAAANGNGIRILLSLSKADTFRSALAQQAKATAEANGATLDIFDAENSIENQVEHIKKAVAENYDVILCGPVDADTTLELEALAGDLPIVFFNSCPDESRLESGRYMYVGSDEKVAGQYQAEYILEQFSSANEISVALLKGAKSHSATKGRSNALKDTLNDSGKTIHYVFEDNANWDQAQALDKMNTWITAYGIDGIEGVLCNNDGMAMGALQAALNNGYNKGEADKFVPIVGIDANMDALEAMKSGGLLGTVLNDRKSQSIAIMNVLKAVAKGEDFTAEDLGVDCTVDGKYVWVPYVIVDESNLDDTIELMKSLSE